VWFCLRRWNIRSSLYFGFPARTIDYTLRICIRIHFVLLIRRQYYLILGCDFGIQVLLWLLVSMKFTYILFLSLSDVFLILFYLGLLQMQLVLSLLFEMRLHIQIWFVLTQNILRLRQTLLAVRIIEVRRLMLIFQICLWQDIQILYALRRIRSIRHQYHLAISWSKRRHCLLLLF